MASSSTWSKDPNTMSKSTPEISGGAGEANATPIGTDIGPPPEAEAPDAEVGLTVKGTTSVNSGRLATVIVRKRLPWLDGQQQTKPGQVPGQFNESTESFVSRQSTNEPRRISTNEPLEEKSPATQVPASSLGGDPALRATGSAPSLRKSGRSGEFKTLSLNSRAGDRQVPFVLPNVEKEKQDYGDGDGKQVLTSYASSEYSANDSPNPDAVDLLSPMGKHGSSDEKLVDRPLESPPQPQDQYSRSDDRTKSRLDISLGAVLSPQHSFRPSFTLMSSGPDEKAAAQELRPPLRQMPKSKSIPQKPTNNRPTRAASQSKIPQTRPPTRTSTLFAMPNHLLHSSSSSSVSPLTQIETSSAPASASPVPAGAVRIGRHQSQALGRAVTGLESLMGEALNVARTAAQNGRNDEVASILDNATSVLRRSSAVHAQMRESPKSDPLVLSPVASEDTSDSEYSLASDSDASSLRSEKASIQTAPTLLTKSAQTSQHPLYMDPYRSDGHSPKSLRGSIKDLREIKYSSEDSVIATPPQLYQPPSAESVVRDFAYVKKKSLPHSRAVADGKFADWGSAADYYGDSGQSVATQPGVRPSIAPSKTTKDGLAALSHSSQRPLQEALKASYGSATEYEQPAGRHQKLPVRRIEAVPTNATISPRPTSRGWQSLQDPGIPQHHFGQGKRSAHLSHPFDPFRYFHSQDCSTMMDGRDRQLGGADLASDRYDENLVVESKDPASKLSERYSGSAPFFQKDISLRHPRRKHISLKEGQGFSLGRYHRRQPIAREWSNGRKRITATISCLNTTFIGLIAGIYAGEVPRVQYQLADTTHKVILGNVLFFACLGLTTLIFWPLPLLHGRKPYTLLAFAIVLPLLFPQALAVSGYRNPNDPLFRCGLLIPRAFKGAALGFANINFLPALFDLFGASLMSEKPHQEIVVYDDIRRQGGGVGVWLGIWSFCFVGSMSMGFCIGAVVISALDPSWGFYIIVMLLAFFLLVNVIAPETRRSPYRRSIAQYLDEDENIKRRVARGEVKLHISNEGPKWWFQEVWAGMILTKRMAFQPGFLVLMVYLAWMYAQVTLVILLLGALLSRDYQWQPQYVGMATLSMAIGAFIAMPLSRANLFSRSHDHPQRTDSMTMRHGRVTWSSHMLRRCVFTLTLPFAAIAFTLSSSGPSISWTTPTIFCGLVGFLSNLAIAECVGLIMETFDTCDLQPGVNSKHRLQSMAETIRRRRTNYSSFPRICAGFFAAQSLGFILSAAVTGVSGSVTRAVGAQMATAIVAAILLVLTVMFIMVLWRWKEVQVVPNNAFGSGTRRGSISWGPGADDPEWKPVIIGNPSGKMRRVNLLELGDLSRWTEIRRLNKLVHG